MNRSMTLKAVLSSVMGLYEVTSVGSLLGLTSGSLTSKAKVLNPEACGVQGRSPGGGPTNE